MDRIKSALYRFMYGRYGTDQLNTFLLVMAVILMLFNLFFFKSSFVSLLIWVLLIINIFRTYSRNIYKRRSENEKYVSLIQPFKRKINVFNRNHKDKEHKYFLCPNCQQTVRVPRGKGKITITCPKCQQKFDRKS